MPDSNSRHPGRILLLAIASVLMVLSSSLFTIHAEAEDIPHENYDLVGSDLSFVISLLNSSIRYSEHALISMYEQSMPLVYQNLSIVQGLLLPAEQLLVKIKDIAGSYDNLSALLPPFTDLSSQMDSFASMEVELLAARDTVVSASELAGLTGDEMLEALAAIQKFNSLILQMNRTIDQMLFSANDIVVLEVDDLRPFSENQLIPLIERLRDLLLLIEAEIDYTIHNEVPWTESEPFLLLWLSSSRYYLGDTIGGGGYLYFNGSFAAGHDVELAMDGENLTTAQTVAGGIYSFAYEIPVDAAWLGSHSMQATALTPAGTLSSTPVPFTIILVPTTITLEVSPELLTIDESVQADVILRSSRGELLADAPCSLLVDGAPLDFTTGEGGVYQRTWLATAFGFGNHLLQATYEGVLPYAASASTVAAFTINIPTELNLTLFADRFSLGRYIVGNGTLMANGTSPLADQEVTLSVDGRMVANVSTRDDGSFAFTIETENMTLGSHSFTAEFLHRDVIWRYSMNDTWFEIVGLKEGKYPFFPILPRWGDLFPGDTLTYLFIGPNAYFFWLLVLVIIGTSVKVLQTRKKRAAAKRAASEMMEALDRVVAQPLPSTISAEELISEIAKATQLPGSPNERIVLYYQRLLAFLTRRGNVSLKESMTHWEVARLLEALGYPTHHVRTATTLFERAFYSGTTLSDEDSISMSAALTNLVSTRAQGASHAS